MSLSRSPSTVTIAAPASSGLAASAVSIQRCDSLSEGSRRSCETVRRPLRVQTWPLNRPRQVPLVGVYRQHRVQQHPVDVALGGLSEPAPALGRRCEVDLTGVLDRQHMAAFCRGNRALAPAFDDALCRHLGIAEKPVEPHLPGAVTLRKPAQTDIFARDHAFDKRRPPLSRRRSPNRPNDQSICDSIPTPLPKPKCRNRNHTDSRFWNPPQSTQFNLPHQMCACPSANAGTHTPCSASCEHEW